MKRANHSLEQKRKVNQKQAEYQREKLKSETNEERNIRIAKVSEYMKEKREMWKNATVEQKRRIFRLKSGLGLINGKEASWIMKSIEEFNHEEEKEYNKRSQELSRRKKKIKKDGLKDENVEDYEKYWEDDENEDEERDGCFVYNEMMSEEQQSEELQKEAEQMDKYMKDMRKVELRKQASPIPTPKMSEYEKIREANMKERMKEMIKSGYWTEDELRNMPGQSYRHLDISSVLE